MSEDSNQSPLSGDVIDMLVGGIPCVAYVGSTMAIITASRDEADGTQINLVVRPINFHEDLVRVGVSVRVDSIARERQEPPAITAA